MLAVMLTGKNVVFVKSGMIPIILIMVCMLVKPNKHAIENVKILMHGKDDLLIKVNKYDNTSRFERTKTVFIFLYRIKTCCQSCYFKNRRLFY